MFAQRQIVINFYLTNFSVHSCIRDPDRKKVESRHMRLWMRDESRTESDWNTFKRSTPSSLYYHQYPTYFGTCQNQSSPFLSLEMTLFFSACWVLMKMIMERSKSQFYPETPWVLQKTKELSSTGSRVYLCILYPCTYFVRVFPVCIAIHQGCPGQGRITIHQTAPPCAALPNTARHRAPTIFVALKFLKLSKRGLLLAAYFQLLYHSVISQHSFPL